MALNLGQKLTVERVYWYSVRQAAPPVKIIDLWRLLNNLLGSYTPVNVPYTLFTLANIKVSHTLKQLDLPYLPTLTLAKPQNLNIVYFHKHYTIKIKVVSIDAFHTFFVVFAQLIFRLYLLFSITSSYKGRYLWINLPCAVRKAEPIL